MISKTIGFRGTLFSDTPIEAPCSSNRFLLIYQGNSTPPYVTPSRSSRARTFVEMSSCTVLHRGDWWLLENPCFIWPFHMSGHMGKDGETICHRIGWWENLQIYRKALYLMVKTMVSCRFPLKPIHWIWGHASISCWWNGPGQIRLTGGIHLIKAWSAPGEKHTWLPAIRMS